MWDPHAIFFLRVRHRKTHPLPAHSPWLLGKSQRGGCVGREETQPAGGRQWQRGGATAVSGREEARLVGLKWPVAGPAGR
jgi:hypothetical protein